MEITLWILGIALGLFALGGVCLFGVPEISSRLRDRHWSRYLTTPLEVFGMAAFFLPLYVVAEAIGQFRKLTLTKAQYEAHWYSLKHGLPLYPDPEAPGFDPLEWIGTDFIDEGPEFSRKWFFEYQKYTIYRMDRRPVGERITQFNDWSILLTFQGEKGWLTRDEFLDCCRKRIDNGERVYAIAVDGELAAITWVVEQERSYQTEIRRTIAFEPNSAACYGGRVMKKYRKQGLYRDLLRGALIDVWERGIRHVYTSVRYDNLPSQRTQEFVGFKPIATYGYRCLMGRVRKWEC
jgi:GNAT superfamily N-acetyltransferase